MTAPITVDAPEQPDEIAYPRLMILSISTRLLVDTTAQIFNPFLTIFATGLGVSVVTMGQLMSLRSIMGLAAPLIGSLADQHGYRRMMRLMLLTIIAGLLLVGFSPSLPVAIAGIVTMGLGLSGFVPTLHAYLSARLPYTTRARGLGMLEYSWALAGIIGLYAMGQLIAVTGWRIPLLILAGGLGMMWVLLSALPSARPLARSTPNDQAINAAHSRVALPQRIRTFFDLGQRARSAYSTIVAGSLIFYAGMQLFITHGAWLNLEYGLGAVALGTVALILGCFDLSASVSVSLFTDRIGKLRSVILGTTGVLIGYAVMPLLNTSVVGAVLGIALARTCFEFGIVSHISLISEQVPEQRGKLMSLSAAFVLCGGTAANLTGPWLYTTHGVWGLSWSSMIALAIALSLLLTQVNEIAPTNLPETF
ncbi:MAG: MFS transporter [Caldilineaceae bacterium]